MRLDRETAASLRIVHLVSHPIQYFVPLYRELSKRSQVQLEVYFYSGQSLGSYFDEGFGRSIEWDVPLDRGYRFHLSSAARKRRVPEGFDWFVDWSIVRALIRGDYDVIWLHGRMAVHAWTALAIGMLLRKPVLLRDEQTLLSGRSVIKRLIKRLILPIFYKRVGGLALGTSNEEFFRHYGTQRIFPAFYCVENERLRQRHAELLPGRREIKRAFGIGDDAPVILFSGKLVDKKRPLLLLEAFRRIRQQLACHLLLAGEGALRSELEAEIASKQILDVHLAGFLNQTEIASAYTAADIFVLPSGYGETWGVVVNEAMNFGLPIILSDRVGSARDLVRHGWNGFVFASGHVGQLAAALAELVVDPAKRELFGARSLETIEPYSYKNNARQILDACRAVTKRNPREHAGTVVAEPNV